MHCASKVNLVQRPTSLLTVLMLTNYGLNVNYDSLTMCKLEIRNFVKTCSRFTPQKIDSRNNQSESFDLDKKIQFGWLMFGTMCDNNF